MTVQRLSREEITRLGTYTIRCSCTNCGAYTSVVFDKGIRVYLRNITCPTCGCKTLERMWGYDDSNLPKNPRVVPKCKWG